MDYKVIFSSSLTNISLFECIILMISIIFVTLFLNKDKISSSNGGKRAIIMIAVVSMLGSSMVLYNYITSIYSLKVGKCALIEGKVEYYSLASASPKGFEYLQVNGKKFMYTNAQLTGGLQHSIADSGIANGSDVRIYYIGETILKVEMKK